MPGGRPTELYVLEGREILRGVLLYQSALVFGPGIRIGGASGKLETL